MTAIYSARDLADWVLKAKAYACNGSIMEHSTGAVSQSLGAYVRQLDRSKYICAFWRREGDRWTWYLHRTKRAATRERLQDLMSEALIELGQRRQDNATD